MTVGIDVLKALASTGLSMLARLAPRLPMGSHDRLWEIGIDSKPGSVGVPKEMPDAAKTIQWALQWERPAGQTATPSPNSGNVQPGRVSVWTQKNREPVWEEGHQPRQKVPGASFGVVRLTPYGRRLRELQCVRTGSRRRRTLIRLAQATTAGPGRDNSRPTRVCQPSA